MKTSDTFEKCPRKGTPIDNHLIFHLKWLVSILFITGLVTPLGANPLRIAPPTNLSLTSSVTASAENPSHPADQAIDGIDGTSWRAGSVGAHWLEIDLQDTYRIHEVRLTTRQQNPGTIQHNVYFRTSEGYEFRATTFDEPTKDQDELVFRTELANVQFVRVESTLDHANDGWREIEVWGTSLPSAASNYALGASVTASAEVGNVHPAEHAADGDSTTFWSAGASDPQWIEFDLGLPVTIHQINLVVRQAAPGNTIHQVRLFSPSGVEYDGENDPGPTYAQTFERLTEKGDVLSFWKDQPNVQKVRVETVLSNTGIAWEEIEILATDGSIPLRMATHKSTQKFKNFSPWIVHGDGWERYLMFYSINSSVENGKPSDKAVGTKNSCNQYHADRIWLTWHFGDGITPQGWDDDRIPTAPETPILILDVGEPESGEGAVIGDPTVVKWDGDNDNNTEGKWHLYYDGSDDCGNDSSREASIFHAVADSWSGPWEDRGKVEGIGSSNPGTNNFVVWPMTFVENDELFLYYIDNTVRLFVAKATDSSGKKFTVLNNGEPVLDPVELEDGMLKNQGINRAHLVKEDGEYKLFFDTKKRSQIRVVTSTDKLSFDYADSTVLFETVSGTWEHKHVGLPMYWKEDGLARIYYTGQPCRPGDEQDDPSCQPEIFNENRGGIGVYVDPNL